MLLSALDAHGCFFLAESAGTHGLHIVLTGVKYGSVPEQAAFGCANTRCTHQQIRFCMCWASAGESHTCGGHKPCHVPFMVLVSGDIVGFMHVCATLKAHKYTKDQGRQAIGYILALDKCALLCALRPTGSRCAHSSYSRLKLLH
jgi:hypothetical protein